MPLRERDSTPSMHRATTRCSTASGTTRGRPGRGCQRRLPGCWRSTKRWSARTARRASSPGGSTPAWRSATRCWSGRSESSTPGSRSSSSGGGTRAGTARRSAPWGADNELLANDRYADHLSALGGRATIERVVERIERAVVLDHLPARVVAACETLDDRVRETGRHRFFLPEHKRACDLMSAEPYRIQDGAAKAFVKDELSMRKEMSERAQLLDKTKTLLEECRQERDRAATRRPAVRAAGELWRLAVEGRAGGRQREIDGRR